MQTTDLIYLKNFSLFEYDATVLSINSENDRSIIILDQTIFYPQGGGQPYDTGIIENNHGKFVVEEVRSVDGIVKHIGAFAHGIFQSGERVHCIVDKLRRELHTRLHSAGHIVDMVVNVLGFDWAPVKGYHFPQGSYVEYAGSLEEVDKEKIEALCNQFIHEGCETTLQFMDKEAMKKICRHVPEYLPANKPLRVVMYGDFAVPCGGTHVKKLSDVGSMSIRKVKQKGSTIRVSYAVEQ